MDDFSYRDDDGGEINHLQVIDVARRDRDNELGDEPIASPYVPPRASDAGDPPTRDERPVPQPPLGMAAALVFGMTAAVFYTMANIALRYCVGIDPFLVSAVKAIPTVVLLGPLLGWMVARGQTIASSTKMVPRFMVAALVGQLVGNAAFQIALGVIGLAASVPITLGVLIVGGAVLGRMILHEPVRPRTVAAMLTLITAVVVLSLPGTAEVASSSTSTLPIWVGAVCAAASGAGYAYFGVAMRQTLTGGVSVPATMFLSGAVGSVALWSVTLSRIGVTALPEVPLEQWGVMLAAGALNFMAFVALSISLKSLPVVAVNLINASQVAMAAVAGVLLFAEPVTTTLVVGIVLTLVGLTILASRRATDTIKTAR